MPIVLALSCAVVYGFADYCGGTATRVHPAAIVTLLGQSLSLILVAAAVGIAGTPLAPMHDLAWGAAGGAAGAVGLVSFYWALGHGAMTVVAPTAAVVGAIVPVVVGLALGERPHPVAFAGIVFAVLCVALVSGAGERDPEGRPRTPRPVLTAALLAGLGFGSLFVAFDRTASSSGAWPLVAARVASVPLIATLVVTRGMRPRKDRRTLRFAAAAGVLDMAANGLYLAAVHGGLLSIVAVISSLYPASTVGLAFVLDGERVSRVQTVGLGLAGVALVMVTLGRR